MYKPGFVCVVLNGLFEEIKLFSKISSYQLKFEPVPLAVNKGILLPKHALTLDAFGDTGVGSIDKIAVELELSHPFKLLLVA